MTEKKRPGRNWISGHPFIREALWIFGALPTLWFAISSITRVGWYASLRLELIVIAGFTLLFTFMGLVNGFSNLSKRILEKKINPLCPKCFAHIPINFVCQCSPNELVPFVPYFTKGLFYKYCRECKQEFLVKSKDTHAGSLRGKCISCGAVIDNWRFFMFRRGEIVISIEKSLHLKTPYRHFETGSYHEKVPGCEHYVTQNGKRVRHWFRWAPSLDGTSISQNLTENIDSIWIDKECGSGGWEKTNIILSSIRKDIRKIFYGFAGKEEEFRAGSLGIQGAKITCDISLEDFLDVTKENKK